MLRLKIFLLLHEYVIRERYVIEYSFTNLLIDMGRVYKSPSCVVNRDRERDNIYYK